MESCESDQDALTDTITSYITFSEDSIIPTKEDRIYPNSKPCIVKDLKQCLNEKKIAFLQVNKQKVREVRLDLNKKIKLRSISKVLMQYTLGKVLML